MGKYKYSTQSTADSASAVGRALPISQKTSIEVCAMIRGKQVDRAVSMLEEVEKLKRAVPYKRAFKDIGHRKGDMTSGRFPQKAAGFIKGIVLSAKANAENKGFNTDELVISHASAQQGGNVMRGARFRRQAKRTHVEIMVKEQKVEKKTRAPNKKVAKKTEKKAEAPKPVEKKVEQPKPEAKETPKADAKPAEKKEQSPEENKQ